MRRGGDPVAVIAEGRPWTAQQKERRQLVHLKRFESLRPLCGQMGRVGWVRSGEAATCTTCIRVANGGPLRLKPSASTRHFRFVRGKKVDRIMRAEVPA